MIIQAPISENSVITFRLTTGETVLAKFSETNETHLIVKNPVIANVAQHEGGIGVYFTPFCVTLDDGEDTVRLLKTALLCEPLRPHPDVKNSYIKATTGLEIPS